MIVASAMAIGETVKCSVLALFKGGGSARLAPKFNVLAASFGARRCLLFGFICNNTFLVSIYFWGSCLGVCCPLGAFSAHRCLPGHLRSRSPRLLMMQSLGLILLSVW